MAIGGGHPGMTGRGPGSGIQGSATGQGPGPGTSTAGHGHPGMTGRGPGSGIAGSPTGQGPVGGTVGGGGGFGPGGVMGGLFGGRGMQSTKGDFGGPSIGSAGGPASSGSFGGRAFGDQGFANIGLANINALANFLGEIMGDPERGRSTHAKGFHPTDLSPRDDVANKAIGDRIGVEASVPGPKSDLGRDFRGRTPNVSGKNQARFGDVQPDFESPPTPTREIRESPFFFDPERQPAVELSEPPRRESPISLSPPRRSDPTPTPMAEPPRRSDPTPAPTMPDPASDPAPGFDSDQALDTVFGLLEQANNFARGQNRRAEFQGRRPGGVGGGPPPQRGPNTGFARNERGR